MMAGEAHMATNDTSQNTAVVVYRPRPWWDSALSWGAVTRTWKSLARCALLMVPESAGGALWRKGCGAVLLRDDDVRECAES